MDADLTGVADGRGTKADNSHADMKVKLGGRSKAEKEKAKEAAAKKKRLKRRIGTLEGKVETILKKRVPQS